MFAPTSTSPSAGYADLNEAQSAAVAHGDGPLLVVAGAGSGKTRTLASRVARLIDDGVAAERILLLTFTRRAAAEMLRRADRLIQRRPAGKVWGGTFHGTANRLLRGYGQAVGVDPSFTVLDQGDAEALFGLIRTELGLGEGEKRFPKKETIAAIYSRMVNSQEKLADVIDQRFPWCHDSIEELRVIFQPYTDRKRAHNVLDYDDLLLYWRALLQSPVAGTVRSLFDHVLVDEYQDTNRVQADILLALCGEGGNLTVVGDDAQAIYGFRAASSANMLEFPERHPSAAVVRLEQNYRSTPQILDAANAVIEDAAGIHQKQLWSARGTGPVPRLVTCVDEPAQAEAICGRVLELRETGVELRDQAVLFRTGHHSAGLELELARRNIPFVKFGGLRFLESAHIKDLLAMLRMLDNPKDELAWHRVLQLLPGIGPATAGKLHRRVIDEAAAQSADPIATFSDLDVPVVAEATRPLEALQSGLGGANGDGPPSEQIEMLMPFCELVFERAYDDPGVRLGDLEQLRQLAAEHQTRSSFLTELILDPPTSTSALAGPPHLDDDYLVLSTIHSAKGGEWDAVYLLHASDGNIPSDMSLGEPGGLEEERRLLYVALTRARDHLMVTAPQRYYHRRFGGDQAHSYAPLSRFLSPVVDRFEQSVAGNAASDPTAVVTSPSVDPVAGTLAQLWS